MSFRISGCWLFTWFLGTNPASNENKQTWYTTSRMIIIINRNFIITGIMSLCQWAIYPCKMRCNMELMSNQHLSMTESNHYLWLLQDSTWLFKQKLSTAWNYLLSQRAILFLKANLIVKMSQLPNYHLLHINWDHVDNWKRETLMWSLTLTTLSLTFEAFLTTSIDRLMWTKKEAKRTGVNWKEFNVQEFIREFVMNRDQRGKTY